MNIAVSMSQPFGGKIKKKKKKYQSDSLSIAPWHCWKKSYFSNVFPLSWGRVCLCLCTDQRSSDVTSQEQKNKIKASREGRRAISPCQFSQQRKHLFSLSGRHQNMTSVWGQTGKQSNSWLYWSVVGQISNPKFMKYFEITKMICL